MKMLLSLKSVSKSFAAVQALSDASFDLCPGEVHALVGENGAGKSTLIRLITGALRPDSGTLEIDGQLISDNTPSRSRELGVAAIYQQPALFPDLSVIENLALGLEPGRLWRRVDWRARRERAARLLHLVGADIDPEMIVSRLSMPQQQLIEIARALGSSARILILDEPTASLSDREVENLFRVIRDLRKAGLGIVYISHRFEEIFALADRVTILRDGQTVAQLGIDQTNPTGLIELMVGRELSTVFPKRRVPIGEPVLRVEHLSSREAGLHNITFEVRAGEIFGLAGLVGSGRSELARALFGLHPVDSGRILLHGRELVDLSPQRAIEAGIGLVPEDRRRHGVIADLPIDVNSSLAILPQISTAGLLHPDEERCLAASLADRLRLKAPALFAPVSSLSGGNQQKVALARWLATRPALLILDEPTQGIDVGAKAEIHRQMGELAAEGVAIIMISSEMPEVLGMSDRLAVMRHGTIAAILDRSEASPELIAAHAFGA